MTCVSAAMLESRITNMQLNKTWTKTVSTFVTTVSHLIHDHKEATQGIHTDDYCIKKLNATFFKHKDVAAHIQTMETQDAMLSRHLGTTIAPCTYKDHLHELSDYAMLLDNCYSKVQSQQRNANNTNVSNGNGNNNGQQSGCGNGSRGCGHGVGGCGSVGCGNNSNFVNKETWNNMSWDECQAIIEACKCARSANNTNVNGGQDNESTIAGPPTTINVANGVDGSNNNNHQANMTNHTSQGCTNPGTMICNRMSSASAWSANASNSARQNKITVNGTTYCSVDAAVRHRISQQANNNKARGALVDSGVNMGLLGEDVQILEHVPNRYVNNTGVAGNKLVNLKLAQATALVNTMEDGPIIVIMS